MSRAAVAIAFLILGACAGAEPSDDPEPAERLDGIYRFSDTPRPLAQPIEGRMTILGDTIFIDAQPGPCRYDDKASWGSSQMVYRCAEMSILIDRANPLRNTKYHTTIRVDERKSVCVRYQTNSAGQRVCAQQETQMVPRDVEVNGILHPKRVDHP